MKILRRVLMVVAVGGLMSLSTSHGYAQLITGFEPGDPIVMSAGDAVIRQVYQGVTPPQGSNQFLVTSINTIGQDGTDGYSNQSGTNAVSNATLQSFFGISGLLGTEGSGFKLAVVVPAGMTSITFRYDFLTTELPSGDGIVQHQDFAFAVLLDSTNSLVGGIRTVATPMSIDFNNPSSQLTTGPVATNPFSFHTGYQTFTISGLTPGTYTLGIGIEDRTTFDNPSGLLVDSVTVVPEPSVIGLGLAGAALLIGLRRRITRV